VDTYPYNEKDPMSKWCKAVRDEYPRINIVGECWTRPTPAVAYWQAGAKNPDGFNSNLPAVMDFPLEEAIRAGLASSDVKAGWDDQNRRISCVYHVLAQDMYYADVNNLLVFIGNHDMDHIADMVAENDLRRVMLADVLIATMRGIPQVFQGDEYGQRSADMSRGHSGLRRPLAKAEDLTAEQKQLLDFHSRLFTWRQNEPVIHKGKTMHFFSDNNTYSFFRYLGDEAIFVFVNAGDLTDLPIKQYQEMLAVYGNTGTDVLTGEKVVLDEGLVVGPLGYLIVKLKK
ncbi:MAG: cyclomaltodextrinase C-terminal domain-containing protein, partial [Paludibacteraceae bacterium]|nr:cyclomaltodextrinase C-terminal domain-containing protein [Paludibacteraceae bacterium]